MYRVMGYNRLSTVRAVVNHLFPNEEMYSRTHALLLHGVSGVCGVCVGRRRGLWLTVRRSKVTVCEDCLSK